MSKLSADTLGYKIQAFTLRGARMSGTASYTPVKDELVHLGAEALITVDGIEVTFPAGDKIVLAKGVTYTFGSSIPLGV